MAPPSQRAAPDAQARDAASIILLRERSEPDASGCTYEVLLQRRHGAASFMAGAFVFPGGALDLCDLDEALGPHLVPGHAACADRLEDTPGAPLAPGARLGLCVAGCRELFEEAGILLARRPSGAWLDLSDAETHRAYHRLRERLNDGALGLTEVLSAEGLRLDPGALVYWAHWITPSLEPKRFDARFFLARLPEGQRPLEDQREATEQAWMSPQSALDASERGELVLPPPTLRNLEDLRASPTLDALFERARRRTIAPILPKMTLVEERITILLPWDPLYVGAEGRALELGSPHPMAQGPSRIVLDGHHWSSRFGT